MKGDSSRGFSNIRDEVRFPSNVSTKNAQGNKTGSFAFGYYFADQKRL